MIRQDKKSIKELLEEILQRRGRHPRAYLGSYYANGPAGNKGCRPRTGAKQAARYRRQHGVEV